MSEEVPALAAQRSDRLVSLDTFRGMTIAGMVLVNNPGSWSHLYQPVAHAPWDGCTPTDLIFPFFLFIVGVAMTLSFDKRVAKGQQRGDLMVGAARRAGIIFLLGLVLTAFPNFRIMTPFILGIAGLGLLGSASAPTRQAALGLVVAAILVWIVDFGHFNGRVLKSDFAWMWPLTNEVDGGRVLRIPGVLQRIGLCYLVASAILLWTGIAGRVLWTLALLNAYWLLMISFAPPEGYDMANAFEGFTRKIDPPTGALFTGAFLDWVDTRLLGRHLYSMAPDPEGLLSTIPAIATTLCGVLTGNFLASKRGAREKVLYLIIAGNVLVLLGWAGHATFPINKKIWTSTYVIYTAGWALIILGACYWANDIKQWRAWSWPFQVFGTNAILIFVASGLMARLIGSMINVGINDEGKPIALKTFLYGFYTSAFEAPKNASIAWALSYVLLWLLLTYPLYRNRWFLKI